MPADATLLEPAPAEHEAAPRARIEERAAAALLALLPGALVVYFGFDAGGFFAGSVGFVALLLTQIVVVRVLVAERPFEGFSRRHAVVVGVFACYAGWTLASALWSHAEARALVEFDRALLYLLLLLLFALVPRERWRMRLMLGGVAGGALIVCGAALITRVLPHLWPTPASLVNNRLSYPITYWNALGMLASIAILLLLGITSDSGQRRIWRALAAAGVPIAATTLFLTFSRGAIGALVVGLVAFTLLGRSRAAAWAQLALIPPTAVALLVTYRANLLDSLHPTTAAAVAQGHTVAIVVALAAAAAGLLRVAVDPLRTRVERALPPITVSRRVGRRVAAAVLAAVVVVGIAAGGPGWISKEAGQFSNGSLGPPSDLRARLASVSSDGRVDLWHAALKGFVSEPARGTGAGTYEFTFYRYRHGAGQSVVNAHSLYLETLGTLGVIGLLLLVGPLAAILAALALRALRGQGPDRVLYASFFSAALAWAVHAGIDWDWQMPVVTAWVFAAGGAALTAGKPGRGGAATGARGRVPLGVALLVVAVTPAILMLSQVHLQRAADAFERGNCAAAESQAIASINVLSIRPQPYQILGYCDLSDGRPQDAVAAMRKAVQQEPRSWEYHYGLAIAESYAGIDPRSEQATAMRLNPRDNLVALMAPVLRTTAPARWLATARSAYATTFASLRLTLR